MKRCSIPAAALGLLSVALAAEPEILFEDAFAGRLKEGWSWIREDPKAWRVTDHALEIRVLPGNMWGSSNNARNVLARPAPDPTNGPVELSVVVENRPTQQYEQVDLVWYYDDSHMVKLGQELVDGELCVVMGREETDKTRTIAKLPVKGPRLRVRFVVSGNRIRGQYQPEAVGPWQDAGECDLPVHGKPHASLQVYQGPPAGERWARITDFRIARLRN